MLGGYRDDRSGVGWIGAPLAMLVAPFAAMLGQMATAARASTRPTASGR